MCAWVKIVRHRFALWWQEFDGGGVGHQNQVKLLKMSINIQYICNGYAVSQSFLFLSRDCEL